MFYLPLWRLRCAAPSEKYLHRIRVRTPIDVIIEHPPSSSVFFFRRITSQLISRNFSAGLPVYGVPICIHNGFIIMEL